MTQHPTPGYFPPPYVMVAGRESNGLGVAGFFISLIGLFIPTGVVALLGLLISLVALGRQPRGFAGLGVLIGLFGTVVWLAVMVFAVLGAATLGVGILICGAAAFILTQPETIEVTSDMINVTLAVAEYEEEHQSLPEDLSGLGLALTTLTDPWGKPYFYKLAEGEDLGFDVVSGGGDRQLGTDDDLALSRLDRVWAMAFEGFESKAQELGERFQRLEGANIRANGSSVSLRSRGRDPALYYEKTVVAAAVESVSESAAAAEVAKPAEPAEASAPAEPPVTAEPAESAAPAVPADPAAPADLPEVADFPASDDDAGEVEPEEEDQESEAADPDAPADPEG
ncbi:MAG: type II secretion system protein GspG [Gemmatimonadales bacterium]